MAWNALLIDGPLERQTVCVEEESSNDVPPVIEVQGHRYVYCGFAKDTPRYRHDGSAARD